MLNTLQARLQQYVNRELPDVHAGFRKGRGTRDQIANICWIIKKAREFQKNICFIDNTKAFDSELRIPGATNCGKFFKRQEYQSTLPASWKTCMQVKKQQLEAYMEQHTDSKLGKEYVKACHPAYLIFMQSTSCKMLGWMKHWLGSRLLREITIISDTQMTPPLWQKVKRN